MLFLSLEINLPLQILVDRDFILWEVDKKKRNLWQGYDKIKFCSYDTTKSRGDFIKLILHFTSR